jgi:hypothetical protein
VFLTAVMEQSLYSPDLAPADFFLFPSVKTALRRKRFQEVENIKKNMTAEPTAVPLEAFADKLTNSMELSRS